MKTKSLFLSLIFAISQPSIFAMGGLDLLTAKNQAFVEYEHEAELEEVEAWSAEIEGSEAHIQIKSHDGIIAYGCHFHGSEVACHEEGDHHLKSEEHNHLDEAFNAAMGKLSKTLSRRGGSLDNIQALKVWKVEDHDHGHGAEESADVWTKVTYELNSKVKTSFIQCHQHGGEEFFCHYKATAPSEPTFEDGDHDDHDHDHGHNH